MVVNGRVLNGVIVLDPGTSLPEGEEVTVLARESAAKQSPSTDRQRHGILDIPVVSLGGVRQPLDAEDDLLGEMLEGRS